MENNTQLSKPFPERRSAPGPLAQQEINRLTVSEHLLTSTLASTAASLADAQDRNVQLAAALEFVQGTCGALMGKVAKLEARGLMRAPNIDAIALAAATSIAATCFAGVPGVKLTGRVKELVAEAMRAGGGVARNVSDDPEFWRPLNEAHNSWLTSRDTTAKRAFVAYVQAMVDGGVAPEVPIDRDAVPQVEKLMADMDTMRDEFADISRALSFWLPSVPEQAGPMQDRIARDAFFLGEFGEDKSAQDLGWITLNVAPDGLLAVPLPADQGETAREKLYRAAISCGHTIEAEEITLRRDSRKPGNALAQLANRLDDVFARLSAAPRPLPVGPSEQPAAAAEATRAVCGEAARKLRTYAAIYTGDKQARRLADELENIAVPSAKPSEAK